MFVFCPSHPMKQPALLALVGALIAGVLAVRLSGVRDAAFPGVELSPIPVPFKLPAGKHKGSSTHHVRLHGKLGCTWTAYLDKSRDCIGTLALNCNAAILPPLGVEGRRRGANSIFFFIVSSRDFHSVVHGGVAPLQAKRRSIQRCSLIRVVPSTSCSRCRTAGYVRLGEIGRVCGNTAAAA